MTTIAHDGTMFAVDSQTTQYGGPKGDCPACGEDVGCTHAHSNKLMVARRAGVTFRGQPVVAWTGAGASRIIRAGTRALKHGMDVEEAYEVVRTYASQMPEAVLVIVTEVTVWELKVSQRETIVTEVRDFPRAWGTGSPSAILAMRRLGLSAAAAVALAIDSDFFSGGAVNYIDTSAKKPEAGSYTYTDEDINEILNTNRK